MKKMLLAVALVTVAMSGCGTNPDGSYFKLGYLEPTTEQREADVKRAGGTYALGFDHGCGSAGSLNAFASGSITGSRYEKDAHLYVYDDRYHEGWDEGYAHGRRGKPC